MEVPLNAVFGVCLEGPLRPAERVVIPAGAISLVAAEPEAPKVAGLAEWREEIDRIRGLRSSTEGIAATAVPDPVQAAKAELADVIDQREVLNRRVDLGEGNSTTIWIFDPRNYRLLQQERGLRQRLARLENAAKQQVA